MIGIYCIQNIWDGKRYIGQSSNIEKRFQSHKNILRRNSHKNRHLQHSWNRYGEGTFLFYVLKECGLDELDKQEREFIGLHKSNVDEFGFNLTSGGNKLSKHIAATIEKIRSWNIGRKHTYETKKKLSEINKGKKPPPRSEEGAERHRLFMKGKKYRLGKGGQKLSDETKAKMSESHKGSKNPQWGKTRTKTQIEKMLKTRSERVYKSRKGMKYKKSEA
mgnify:FL=1